MTKNPNLENEMLVVMNRVKQKRIELGYSYYDMERLTGITRSTLQRYETGKTKNVPMSTVNVLATALDTTPEWIMGWTENDKKEPANEIDRLKSKLLSTIKDFSSDQLEKLLDYAEAHEAAQRARSKK